MIIRTATIAAVMAAQTAFADEQAIPHGTMVYAPAQLAHIFASACIGSVPTLMQDRATTAAAAFGWDATDFGTDAGWVSPNGAISLTIDGNPIEATCAMSMPTDAAGDTNLMIPAIMDHIAEHNDGIVPITEGDDDTLRWQWTRPNVSYTLELYRGDAVALTLLAEA